jgi:uncharacterized protein YbaR (Trm112 family)
MKAQLLGKTAVPLFYGVRRKPAGVTIPFMIPADLLEILVCPACRQSLAVRDNGAALQCSSCAKTYPVRDGIPILLVDQAT